MEWREVQQVSRVVLSMTCKYCKGPWEISSGPGRVVGPVANSIFGVSAPLPDDFTFEYCPKCHIRNMTPELKERLLAIEAAYVICGGMEEAEDDHE